MLYDTAADERCSPLRVRDFLYNAAVGAAIGRPVSMAEFSLHPRSKQHYNIAGTAQCAAPAMLIIFSMLIYGVRLATSSGSPPTDEVFIQILHRLYPERQEI